MPADPTPDRLIASGRAADVYDLGDGTVLRRYRDDRHDLACEARAMSYVAEHGVRVPAVVEASGTDLVMERIEGRTMLNALAERPQLVLRMARLLADLQSQIASIPATPWLMPPGWSATHDDDDPVVLHLDLHPMNVLLADDGPVVIDWTNVSGGPAGFDAASSYVVMATYEVAAWHERLARRAFVGAFRRARGRRLIDPFLAAACDHRLADRNTTPDERERIVALRRRYA